MLFKVTKFNGRFDNDATQVKELSWEHWVHRLGKRVVCKEKWGDHNQNPLFSPVEYATSLEGYTFDSDLFKVDRATKEKRVVGKIWKNAEGLFLHTDLESRILRCNENVRLIFMAVFDYDSHPATEKKPEIIIRPEDVIEKVKALNYAIYSTHSSTAAYPRFRLVLPFKAPLSPVDFKAGWPFGFENIDESCKDLARMLLLPTVPPEHEKDAFFYAEREKAFFAPKIDRAAKRERKKKKRRGDYNTLDAVHWFQVHGMQPVQDAPYKYHVVCPWASTHTGEHQGETDTVLWVEPNKWPTFNCSHDTCQQARRDINSVMALWGDQDDFCREFLTPDKVKSDIEIKCLGHDDGGRYYYQCNATNHIVPLKASDHRELTFYQITAVEAFWLKNFGDRDSGKVDWKHAARVLMGSCHRRGYFRMEMLRGGGVWEDEGRLVVHLGKKLLVDGVETSIFDFKSEYTYESMVKEVELPSILSQEKAKKTYDLIMRLPFASTSHNALLAGVIVCGYLSGVITWRPHVWITGNAGSGKTQILSRVLAPLWVPMGGVNAEGVSTEAGLRQVKIRHNAVPVIVDESESNDRREIDRVAGIVRLARSSSSDSKADVVKGNTAATGHTYTVRSCFVLCSIVENLEHEQDKERFSVLQVIKSEASKKNWAALRADLDNTFTKDFALSLYALMIDQADLVKANGLTFHQALMRNLPHAEPRWCDQMGMLLGGAWTLATGEAASHEQAWSYFRSLEGIMEMTERSESSIPKKALATCLAHIPIGQSKSLGELVEIVLGVGNAWEAVESASAILMRYGLRVQDGALMVSSNHPLAEKIFKDAGFPGHYNLLARIEGATKGIPMRFGHHHSKAVRIPLPKPEQDLPRKVPIHANANRTDPRDDADTLPF